jgi:hypothetical protein
VAVSGLIREAPMRFWLAVEQRPTDAEMQETRSAEIAMHGKDDCHRRAAHSVCCSRSSCTTAAAYGYRWGVERKRALLDREALA